MSRHSDWTIAIGHAALDAAIACLPDQHFTPRQGMLVIRDHARKEQ
jgi:hypothetical protein